MIKVRAVRMGFYGNLRRREGQEFEIKSKAELGNWMEVVNAPVESGLPASPVESEELVTKRAAAEAMMEEAKSAEEALKSNSSKADKKAAADLMELAKSMADEVSALELASAEHY